MSIAFIKSPHVFSVDTFHQYCFWPCANIVLSNAQITFEIHTRMFKIFTFYLVIILLNFFCLFAMDVHCSLVDLIVKIVCNLYAGAKVMGRIIGCFRIFAGLVQVCAPWFWLYWLVHCTNHIISQSIINSHPDVLIHILLFISHNCMYLNA